MKKNELKHAFTLMEMLVVVSIVAALTVFALPAAKSLFDSMHTDGSTKAMINSALSCARAMAAKEQTYVGIRFQKTYTSGDLLAAPQYMIFIINDANATNLAPGFRAMEGMEPIKLPDSIGAADLRVRTAGNATDSNDTGVNNSLINSLDGIRNVTTFSIVFSPAGRLIIHDVRVRNKDGQTNNNSYDDIFNTRTNVENNNNRGMFYQDEYYSDLTLGQERSRNSFIIYDTHILKKTDSGKRWDYLNSLQQVFVNPYTGTLVN